MSLNVLVVDDSAVMRHMIIKTLGLSGIPVGEIHQASNGREGLQALEKSWVDLVLVDINMPVMNGMEFIGELRARPESANLPVIVVSTDGSMARMQMMQEHRAEFVHKPFTAEVLRDKILKATGVTYEELTGSGTVQSDGPDF